MKCPKCPGGTLAAVEVRARDRSRPGADALVPVHLEQCSTCGGVWFDADELHRCLDGGVAPLEHPELHPEIKAAHDAARSRCPRCAAVLEPGPVPGSPDLTADSCPKCAGLWLDGGEMARAGGAGAPLADRLKSFFGSIER